MPGHLLARMIGAMDTRRRTPSRSGARIRGRWLAVGLALGLTVASSVVFVRAAGAPVPSVFSPIAPCRLFDTRPASAVGPRTTPLNPDETYTVQVTGANGECTIPVEATAVVLNVTSVNPTARSFLTLFPAGVARPNSSNLNVLAGQAPTPNLVTVSLGETGAVSIYNSAGTTHLLGDLAGYYTSATGELGAIPGPPGDADRLTPDQIGRLQWGRVDFATGTEPFGVAYDGHSIWVSNSTADTVSRIDRVSGTRTDFAAGVRPGAVVFDGVNIWVANIFGDSVSRFDIVTGARTDFSVGDRPTDMVFDGVYLWVTNFWSNSVSRIERETGASYDVAVGTNPVGIAFDGTDLWVANSGDDTVSRVDRETGALTDFPAGALPGDLAFDGRNMWVVSQSVDKVTVLDTLTGGVTDIPTGADPSEVLFDGRNIWVTLSGSNQVTQFHLLSGAQINHPTGAGPQGMTYDGTNLWIANYSVHTITRIAP